MRFCQLVLTTLVLACACAASAAPTIQQNKPRPHLFYTAAEIDAFATVVDVDPAKSWYEAFIKNGATERLSAGIYTGSNTSSLRDYFEQMDQLAIAALVDVDPGFRQQCINLGRDVLLTTASNYSSMNLATFWKSATAPSAMDLAALYDSIYDELSSNERSNIENNLFDRLLADIQTATNYNEATNKGSIIHAAMGCVALAIEDQSHFNLAYGASGDSEPTFIWTIEDGYGPDGMWLEPTQNYHQYTMDHVLGFAQAAYNCTEAGAVEVLQTSPSLLDIYETHVAIAFPNMVIVPTGDSRWPRNLRKNHGEVLNSLYPGSEVVEWVLTNSYDAGSVDRAHTNFVWEILYISPFGDPGTYQPPSKIYTDGGSDGFGVLRHGQGTDQNYAFIDFASHQPNHDHRDKLAIYLANASKVPVTSGVLDDRDGYGETIFQNSVVVDETSQAKKAGDIDFFETTRNTKLGIICASSDDAYSSIDRYERILLMVKDDYVFDLFTIDDNPNHTYDWVHHRIDPISFSGVSGFSSASVGSDDGYGELANVNRANASGGLVIASSYSDSAGGADTFILTEAQDDIYQATAPGPHDVVEHPLLFVRRSSSGGTQFAAVHALSGDGNASVASISESFGVGGVGSNLYAITVTMNGATDDVLVHRGTPGAITAFGSYSTDARAAVVRRNAGNPVAAFLVQGTTLDDGPMGLIDTFGDVADVESDGNTVSMSGSITRFCIYAPVATQVLLDGQPVAFLRIGDLVVSDTDDHNLPPVADPGGPYAGSPDDPIAFDGSGSFDPEDGGLTYAWDFGDGSTGTGMAPLHAYTSPNIYTVTLTVSDGEHVSAPASTTASVNASAGITFGAMGPAVGVTQLLGARPNPFGSYTTIHYELAQSASVDIGIYDVSGRLIRQLSHGQRAAGEHVARWDGVGADGLRVPAGTYFYRLDTAGLHETRKILILR